MEKVKEMWNSRYAEETYAYGMDPNIFFKETIDKLQPGKILFAAEGEGRNAVYAAKKDWNVTAFDISEEAKKKALQLATKENTDINYEVGSLFDLPLTKETYDSAVLIFAHFPTPILSSYHKKIGELINPNGILILEGFSKGHLKLREENPKVGGPNKIEMLFSVESIKKDFPNFEILQLEEVEIELNEGIYHNGTGKVIRFVGRKI